MWTIMKPVGDVEKIADTVEAREFAKEFIAAVDPASSEGIHFHPKMEDNGN